MAELKPHTSLFRLALTYHCPTCRHPLTKLGGWFTAIGRFNCDGCGRFVRLSYDEKLRLFHEHCLQNP